MRVKRKRSPKERRTTIGRKWERRSKDFSMTNLQYVPPVHEGRMFVQVRQSEAPSSQILTNFWGSEPKSTFSYIVPSTVSYSKVKDDTRFSSVGKEENLPNDRTCTYKLPTGWRIYCHPRDTLWKLENLPWSTFKTRPLACWDWNTPWGRVGGHHWPKIGSSGHESDLPRSCLPFVSVLTLTLRIKALLKIPHIFRGS